MGNHGRGRFELETEAAPLRTARLYHKIVTLHVPYGVRRRTLIVGIRSRTRTIFVQKQSSAWPATAVALFEKGARFSSTTGRPIGAPHPPARGPRANETIFTKRRNLPETDGRVSSWPRGRG
jgi:hypothetical protein